MNSRMTSTKEVLSSPGQCSESHMESVVRSSGERIKIVVIGGSPTAGLGAGPQQSYLQQFKEWLRDTFTDQAPDVVDLSMAKASAAVAARCILLNDQGADIVILELLHDEVHSNMDADRVPGAAYALVCRSCLPH
jgi:hypothetical protein